MSRVQENNMIKRTLTFLTAAAAVVLLGACTLTITPEPLDSPPSPQTSSPSESPRPVQAVPGYPHNETLTYQCSNSRLLVRYTSNDSAQVFYNGWENLTRTITTSGHWVYRNSDFTWYASGRTGYLEQHGTVVRSDCRY